jgi:hypothetical protein
MIAGEVIAETGSIAALGGARTCCGETEHRRGRASYGNEWHSHRPCASCPGDVPDPSRQRYPSSGGAVGSNPIPARSLARRATYSCGIQQKQTQGLSPRRHRDRCSTDGCNEQAIVPIARDASDLDPPAPGSGLRLRNQKRRLDQRRISGRRGSERPHHPGPAMADMRSALTDPRRPAADTGRVC